MPTKKKKGPGKSFRKGLSLPALLELFPNNEKAEQWLAEARWPSFPWCPRDGSVNIQHPTSHPQMPYRCRDCRKFFSVRTLTLMASSNLSYQTWIIALYILATGIKGTSSMKLHRDLGISQKAAWHLAHRIRATWKSGKAPLSGPVEADETYIGGKEGNKHRHKKLNAGRGMVGKTAVVGLKGRETGEVRAEVVKSTATADIQEFVETYMEEGSPLYTDESAAYRNIPNRQVVKHKVGEYVNGQAHTNGMESFWAMLKRGYHGTYHQMSAKHLPRYINEFEGRHNSRPFDTLEQMRLMAQGMIGRRLTYKELVGREE